ncbi:MAG: GGDEF domain-containing protein [Candidatus Nanopelagicales bacterium]
MRIRPAFSPRPQPAPHTVVPGQRRAGVPPIPYVVLTGLVAMAAAFSALFVFLPTAGSDLRTLDIVTAVTLTIGAVLLWVAGPRARTGWPLDVAIVASITIAAFGVTQVQTSDGQLLIGMGMVLFAVFAAYFRPVVVFAAELSYLLVAYSLAVFLGRHLVSTIYFVVVLVVVSTVSIMVAFLAERLRQQALRDSLTGLLNRRGLDVMSGPVHAAAVRSGNPVMVAVLDLDSFKQFNDREGHLAGDRLLAQVAADWSHELRAADLLVRFGGDEFVLVLPGATPDHATELARRLNAVCPVSVGFSLWEPNEDLYAALARADDALYRQKDERRTLGRHL